MRKRLEHLIWRHEGMIGNALAALLVIAFVAIGLGVSVFSFWLKIQMTSWLFGPF